MAFSIPQSRPLALSSNASSRVYLLFAIAIAITAVGVFLGSLAAVSLLRGGFHMILLLIELGLLLTARFWVERRPWNVLLFGLFPLLSGVTITPYLWYVTTGFANGNAILGNALIATALMAAAAGVFARTTSLPLVRMGGFLTLGLIGLLVFGLLQLFVPALRASTGFEMALSGAGVVLFAAFTAFDIQRIEARARAGENPILLALSLYLDIFNLFLYVLRFMMAISGQRR